MNAPRDNNYVPVMQGVSSADGVTPMPLLIDPVSGRVLITIVSDTDTPIAGSQPLKRDDNHVPVRGGASLSDGKTVLPFQVSSNTGALSVDLING